MSHDQLQAFLTKRNARVAEQFSNRLIVGNFEPYQPATCNTLCDPANRTHTYLHASRTPAIGMQYLVGIRGTVGKGGLHGLPPNTEGTVIAVNDAIECDPRDADCDTTFPHPLVVTWKQL